ncbi:glycosyltransferase [Desulfitobacterium sp. AusDCA]|uniref:glycosyltransferase n=1 Tax=Desulfitobacterium sp. AusDCA TaxID=3240383 RepID=UPI003DA6EB16
MKISLCMIVKNEEEFLEQSLRSASRYVEDLVVVDTGSTDCTKEIALKYTQKVYDFSWCNDFSAARNFSLEKASYDWILVLDADEKIIDLDIRSVQQLITANNPVVGRIKRINILSDATGERHLSERISRFFNRQFFRYEGIIHEQIVNKNGNPHQTVPLDITVKHLGYTQEVINRTDKISRNLALLEQALQEAPKDTYLLYQLGKSYYLAKNYQKAIRCFKKALSMPINFELEYIEDLVETYGYALINNANYPESLELEKFEQYYGNSADYLFLMGLIYMNNAKFLQAVGQFLRCTKNKPGKAEGINSYLPNYNLGVIYECLGQKKEAVHYYKKCRNYPAALKRLKEI